MKNFELVKLLDEFMAIKLPVSVREFIKNARYDLQKNGDLSLDVKREIRDIAYRYRKQLNALREARENGRKTLAIKKLGLKKSQAEKIIIQKQKEEEERKNDLGF